MRLFEISHTLEAIQGFGRFSSRRKKQVYELKRYQIAIAENGFCKFGVPYSFLADKKVERS